MSAERFTGREEKSDEKEDESPTLPFGSDFFWTYLKRIKIPPNEELLRMHAEYKETKSLEIRNLLMESQLQLVVKIAYQYHRFFSGTHPVSSLISDGYDGLFSAVEIFDASKGVPFSSYCAIWIHGRMKRAFFENANRNVKWCTTAEFRKLLQGMGKVIRKLNLDSIEISPEAIAAAYDDKRITPKVVREYIRRQWDVSSLVELDADMQFNDGDGGSRQNLVADDGQKLAIDQAGDMGALRTFRRLVTEFAQPLDERDKCIIFQRLLADEPLTLQEIGDLYGCTRESIRQREARLRKLIGDFLRKAGYCYDDFM
jgi:RNA polymerase sigma-32 factor